MIAADLAAVETESVAGGVSVRRFADLAYETLESWSCARRVVAKAEYLPTANAKGEGKANPRFVVTSLAAGAGGLRAEPPAPAHPGGEGLPEQVPGRARRLTRAPGTESPA